MITKLAFPHLKWLPRDEFVDPNQTSPTVPRLVGHSLIEKIKDNRRSCWHFYTVSSTGHVIWWKSC